MDCDVRRVMSPPAFFVILRGARFDAHEKNGGSLHRSDNFLPRECYVNGAVISVGVTSESDGGVPSELVITALFMGLGRMKQAMQICRYHNDTIGLLSVPR